MSHSLNRTRRWLRAAPIAAIAAAAALPASASATSPLRVHYLCSVPNSLDRVGLDLDVSVVSPPPQWPVMRPLPRSVVKVTGKWAPDAWVGAYAAGARELIQAPIEPATDEYPETPGGTLYGRVVQVAQNSATPFNIAAEYSAAELSADSIAGPFTTTAGMQSVALSRAGGAEVVTDRLRFNLALTRADGSRLDVEKSGDDRDIDNDPSTFEVYCRPSGPNDEIRDEEGDLIGHHPPQNVTWFAFDSVDGPTAPGRPWLGRQSPGWAHMTFGSSVSKLGVAIAKYEVFAGSTKIGEAPGHVATLASGTPRIIGLTGVPPGMQRFTVKAIDAAGRVSSASPESDPVMPVESQDVYYELAGSATIPALMRSSSAPVSSPSPARLSLGRLGDIISEWPLVAQRVRLKVLGSVPVTGDLAFIPSASATGEFVRDGIELNAQYRLRLAEVYLFGSVPIAGAGTCQSKRISAVTLRSDAFSFTRGGTLTGTYDLSDLSGCGAYNGVITPLTASAGNTVSFTASPVAFPAP